MKNLRPTTIKKKYQSPKLKKLGKVKNLTSGAGSFNSDGMTGFDSGPC